VSKVIVQNRAREFALAVDARAKAAVNSATHDIFNKSQDNVPVDTGTLRGSGKIDPAQGAGGQYRGKVHYETNYAIYVEMGTSRMAAQPYLVPAAMLAEGKFKSNLKRSLGAL
jgi:HK97 gp10 family phage protein